MVEVQKKMFSLKLLNFFCQAMTILHIYHVTPYTFSSFPITTVAGISPSSSGTPILHFGMEKSTTLFQIHQLKQNQVNYYMNVFFSASFSKRTVQCHSMPINTEFLRWPRWMWIFVQTHKNQMVHSCSEH